MVQTIEKALIDGDTEHEFLKEMAGDLLRGPCMFWACEGYEVEPEDMVTCFRCRTLHDLFKAYPTLKQEIARGDSGLQAGYPGERGAMDVKRRR